MTDENRTNAERVEAACEVMHDAYERAAVGAGWETNPASRKPWSNVPEANKATMRAAVGALLDWLAAESSRARYERTEAKWEELRKVIHEGHRKEVGCVLDEAPYGPGCFGDTCIYAPPYEGTYAHALFCSCSAPEWPCSIIVDFDYIDLGEEAYEAKYHA